MVWNGMENGMEQKFRYGIWKMPQWNGMEDFKNGMEDNLPYFHTNSKLNFVHFLQKNTYRCRVVIKNIVTEIFNFNIYTYCLLTNCGAWVVYIVKTVTYCIIASTICSMDVIVDDFDRFDLFFFEIDYLPSPKFCFLISSWKLVSAISFPFQLNFIYAVFLVFQLTMFLFGVKA